MAQGKLKKKSAGPKKAKKNAGARSSLKGVSKARSVPKKAKAVTAKQQVKVVSVFTFPILCVRRAHLYASSFPNRRKWRTKFCFLERIVRIFGAYHVVMLVETKRKMAGNVGCRLAGREAQLASFAPRVSHTLEWTGLAFWRALCVWESQRTPRFSGG
ncbi:unnamed protein product [Ixodes pacificus]